MTTSDETQSYGITITGPADVLEEVRLGLAALTVQVTEVTLLDSGGDALDAPFSAKKFIAAAGIVTALLNTGTAGLKFAETLQGALDARPGVTLTISDAKTNQPLASVDHTTPTSVVLGALKPTLSK